MYKVRLQMDNNYLVYNTETEETCFYGSLSDCEAWIRLQEGGYF